MKKRIVLILTLFIILCLLCIYTGLAHPWISIEECLKNPKKYDGRLITEYWEPQIGKIYSNGFQLIQRHAPSIRVYCDTTGLQSGEFVGLKAHFHDKGYLTAEQAFVATNRRYKIWLSVIPVFLILFLFLYYYRINLKKFQFELRNNA